MSYPIIKITVPNLIQRENLIKLRPLTIHLDLLQAALDRLQIVDNIFSSNSREYLIEHHLNKNTGWLEFHNGLPIPTRTGICGLIRDRFHHHIEFENFAFNNFMDYLEWRFFDDKLFPLNIPFSEFPAEVQRSMDEAMSEFSGSRIQKFKEEPERFIYLYHHHPLGIEQYPLGALDPKSPYGALRLRKIKEMVVTLQDILSYLLSYIRLHTTSDSAAEKYPLLGSVIVPNHLLPKDITSQNENQDVNLNLNLNPFGQRLKPDDEMHNLVDFQNDDY